MTPEASKVVARNLELPQCEGLKAVAALTTMVQFVLVSRLSPNFDLTIPVQIGFGLIGFMIGAYLLRDRGLITSCKSYGADSTAEYFRSLFRTLPLPQMAVVVAGVLYLPYLFSFEEIKIPDMAEVPTILIGWFTRYFADFQKPGFDGRTLLLWPIVVLFAPRRLLSLVLLTVMGSGLVLQFAGLFSSSLRPASMMGEPSAFDLLAIGMFLAILTRQRRIGQSEAQIGFSAVLAGLVMAAGLVGSRLLQGSTTLGAFALLSAPEGFGLANLVVEIVATTLVSSLWWRDLGGMMEGVKQAPAH